MLNRLKTKIKELVRYLVYEGVERYHQDNSCLCLSPDQSFSTYDTSVKKWLYFQSLYIYLSKRLTKAEEILLLFNILSLRLYNIKLPNTDRFSSFAYKVETYHYAGVTSKGTYPKHTRFFDFMDFDELKIPIRTHTYTSSAKIFFSNQYMHPKVHIQPGDHCIDAGVLFGDTSLWFAYQAGSEGLVYSFEFVPDFVKCIKSNFSLNPEYSKKISLHQYALWDTSGDVFDFEEDGGRTHVQTKSVSKSNQAKASKPRTITIDDFVEKYGVKKLDFIKMDIEGAEVKALRGAVRTLNRFRPKLAICLYHKDSDFINIPQLIDSLELCYELYLGHHTDGKSETVLYARIPD